MNFLLGLTGGEIVGHISNFRMGATVYEIVFVAILLTYLSYLFWVKG